MHNNPLSLVGPYGHGIIEQVFAAVALVVAVYTFQYELLPAIGAELGFTTTSVALATAVNGAIAGGIVGGIAGAITTGTLQGALLGAAQGAAFAGLAPYAGGALGSTLGNTLGASVAGRFIATGLVGGLFSVAQNGNFGSGFLAAGVGSLAGPLTGGGGFTAQGAIVSAVLGGFASTLGGGKFANGAITGAFAYAAGSVASRQAQTSDAENGLANGAPDCGSDAYACTRVNPETDKAEIEYTDRYHKLDSVEQAAVTAHEGVHVGQIDSFINTNVTVWDRLATFFDPSFIPNKVYSWIDMNRAALETPAYNAGIAYLNTHMQDYGGVYAGSVSRMIWEQTYTRDLIKSGKISGAGD